MTHSSCITEGCNLGACDGLLHCDKHYKEYYRHNTVKGYIAKVNRFHLSIDQKSDPDYVVIVMRDNAVVKLPKDNIHNSWSNIKKQLNKHLKLMYDISKEGET